MLEAENRRQDHSRLSILMPYNEVKITAGNGETEGTKLEEHIATAHTRTTEALRCGKMAEETSNQTSSKRRIGQSSSGLAGVTALRRAQPSLWILVVGLKNQIRIALSIHAGACACTRYNTRASPPPSIRSPHSVLAPRRRPRVSATEPRRMSVSS